MAVLARLAQILGGNASPVRAPATAVGENGDRAALPPARDGWEPHFGGPRHGLEVAAHVLSPRPELLSPPATLVAATAAAAQISRHPRSPPAVVVKALASLADGSRDAVTGHLVTLGARAGKIGRASTNADIVELAALLAGRPDVENAALVATARGLLPRPGDADARLVAALALARLSPPARRDATAVLQSMYAAPPGRGAAGPAPAHAAKRVLRTASLLEILPADRLALARAIFARSRLAGWEGDAAGAIARCDAILAALRDVPERGYATFDAAARAVLSRATAHDLHALQQTVEAIAAVAPGARAAAVAAICGLTDGPATEALAPVLMVGGQPEGDAVARLAGYTDLIDSVAAGRAAPFAKNRVGLADLLFRLPAEDAADLAATTRAVLDWLGTEAADRTSRLFTLAAQIGEMPVQRRAGLVDDMVRLCPSERGLAASSTERAEFIDLLAALPAPTRRHCVDCCVNLGVQITPYALRALADLPAEEREAFLTCFADLRLSVRRLGQSPMGGGAVSKQESTPAQIWVQAPTAARGALAEAVVAMRGETPWRSGSELQEALQILLRVAPAERAEVGRMTASLRQRGRMDLVEAVALTERSARGAHQAALMRSISPQNADLSLRQVPSQDTQAAANLENVMDLSWRHAVEQSYAALRARFGAETAANKRVAEVVAYVRRLADSPPKNVADTLLRVRGGASEIENALRTLVAPSRPGDYSDAVVNIPERVRDVSLVWHAIEAYRPSGAGALPVAQAQANMRHALVMALAQSIEDDEHRVCGVGQRHRIVGVLQGYYTEVQIDTVTVGQILSALGAEFDKNWGDAAAPPPEALRAFRSRALEQATYRFGAEGQERTQFEADLDAFLTVNYGARD